MLQLARQGKLYGIEEVTYGTTPAIGAALLFIEEFLQSEF